MVKSELTKYVNQTIVSIDKTKAVSLRPLKFIDVSHVEDPMVILRIVMMVRGMDVPALAKQTGYGLGTLRVEFSRGFPNKTARLAVEYALNHAIWAPAHQVQDRHLLMYRFTPGDPFKLPFRKLKQIAARYGIADLRGKTLKRNIILCIADQVVKQGLKFDESN